MFHEVSSVLYPTKSAIVFRLHRPFFDLEPVTDIPLHAKVPLLAYENLDDENFKGSNNLQRYLTERFRFSLIAESGLSHYARLIPTEVQKIYRSTRWQRLCHLTENFSVLPPSQKLAVLYLLMALGFHRFILKLVPEQAIVIMQDEISAEITYIRAIVRYRLSLGGKPRNYRVTELEEVIKSLPVTSHVRHMTLTALLVHSAKVCQDKAATSHYRSLIQPYVDASWRDVSTFEYYMLRSRFFRSASYEPFLKGDLTRLVDEMNQAEHLARTAPAQTTTEHLIAQENLFSVLESRMREAVHLGDLDLAQERLGENMRSNPLDAKVHIEMGELLLQRGNFVQAASEYTLATRYSPPGGAPSCYMAGYCYESLDDIERATEYYEASLYIDPEGISPIQGLLRTAKRSGKLELFRWAEEKAAYLVKEGYITQCDLL